MRRTRPSAVAGEFAGEKQVVVDRCLKALLPIGADVPGDIEHLSHLGTIDLL